MNKSCNAKRHARKNKSEVENHGKTGDARCKIRNRDPATCIGAKACTGSAKVRKTTSETKTTLKLKYSKL